jgi:hypothetical protein
MLVGERERRVEERKQLWAFWLKDGKAFFGVWSLAFLGCWGFCHGSAA